MIRLILAIEEFGKKFPGFEREVHGIEVDPQGDYWMRAVIETPGGKTNGSKLRAPRSGPPLKRRRKAKSPEQRPEQAPETQGPPPTGNPTLMPDER